MTSSAGNGWHSRSPLTTCHMAQSCSLVKDRKWSGTDLPVLSMLPVPITNEATASGKGTTAHPARIRHMRARPTYLIGSLRYLLPPFITNLDSMRKA